jgi:hypothetical protein
VAKLLGSHCGTRLLAIMHRGSTGAVPLGSNSRTDHPRAQRRPIREIGHMVLTAVLVMGPAVAACLLLGVPHLRFH